MIPQAPSAAVTSASVTKSADPEQNGQAALAAEIAAVPDAGAGHRLSVPFASQVGAAAFRSGGDAVVVFDARKPIDLQRIRDDPVFGAATVQLLPAATILRLKLPLPAELRLARQGGLWIITAIGGNAVPPPVASIVHTRSTVACCWPQRSRAWWSQCRIQPLAAC